MTNLLFSKKYLAYRVAIGFVLGIAAGLLFKRLFYLGKTGRYTFYESD